MTMKLLNKLLNKKPCAAVIVAAGFGTRMEGTDKIMTELAGKPVVVHTISAFESARFIDEIVVVARRSQVQTIKLLVAKYQFQKVKTVVPGGASRVESVWNGLQAVSRKMEYVAVQDGARPMVTAQLINKTVLRARRVQAAAPGVPVKDTIKQVDDQGMVVATPPRDALRAVQTPQVFQKDLLRAAWKRARKDGSSLILPPRPGVSLSWSKYAPLMVSTSLSRAM
mgnify:CR=1 FL=1